MNFYEQSDEIAARCAVLYRVRSPRWECACGWWSHDQEEHGRHRAECQATWVR